jgi:hypothetical protein
MFARVPEAVRRLRRHDEHLIRVQLHGLITGGPGAATFEEDERLRVWVHMELHQRARRRPDDEDRNPDAGARKSLEQRRGGAELQLVEVEDVNRLRVLRRFAT